MTKETFATEEEFYKAHLANQQEYVRVWVARPFKAGEQNDGMPVTKDGYALYDENDVYRQCKKYLSPAEFTATMTPADNDKLALPVPKKDLAQEGIEDIMPVQKNEKIKLGPAGEETSTAPCDGFTFMRGGQQYFLDNQQLMSQFNYAGSHIEQRKELLVTDNIPLKGFILDKAVTVTYSSTAYTYTYAAGTFVYRDKYGCHVEEMRNSANTVLRLVTTNTDAHKTALDNQADLKKIWLKKKALKTGAERANV